MLLHYLKLAPEDVRLPLVKVKDSTKKKVKEALKLQNYSNEC